jgi:hypothetical protein
MTLDDRSPGLRLRLSLLVLAGALALIAAARSCAPEAEKVAEPPATLPEPGTSVSKDHGASTGAQPER